MQSSTEKGYANERAVAFPPTRLHGEIMNKIQITFGGKCWEKVMSNKGCSVVITYVPEHLKASVCDSYTYWFCGKFGIYPGKMSKFTFKISFRFKKKTDRTPRATIGKAYDWMELYFGAAVLINAVPFTYDRTRRRYDFDRESTKYRIWFVLMLLGMFSEWAQVTRELIRSKFDQSVNRGEWGMIYFVFVSWTLLAACHYSFFKKGNEVVNHMNQTIRMREYFTDEKLPPTNDHQLVKPHIYLTCFQGFFQCLMVAVEGTKNQYLYSNVPPEYRNLLTSGIWAIWAYYRVMTNFLAGYFLIFGGIFHVSMCNQVIGYREQQQNLTAAEKFHIFRMLQVLTNRYSEGSSMIFIPHMTIFVAQNLILGIYGTVKFHDQIDISNYMNFPIMSVLMVVLAYTFYTKNATVYETTKDEARDVIRALLTPAEQLPSCSLNTEKGRRVKRIRNVTVWHYSRQAFAVKEAKRVARACPVVGVPFGSLYKIKRTTVLNLFNFIACNAISTLITYP